MVSVVTLLNQAKLVCYFRKTEVTVLNNYSENVSLYRSYHGIFLYPILIIPLASDLYTTSAKKIYTIS